MTAGASTWFEDDDPRDLRRWAIAALVVLGVHLGAIAAYVYVHRPDEIGDDAAPLSVQLAPVDNDIDQPEVEAQPEVQPKPVEEPPPPPPPPPDAVAMPEEKPVEQPVAKPQPAPTPARTKGGAPQVSASWETSLIKHLQQFKRYPSGAQSRGEEGVVMLSFSVDRTGRVLSHQIARGSGYPELDAEVMSMIQRAQPLPAFPPTMSDATLDLTVPIRFSLR
jgi:periplasmic protein TonB